MKKLAIALLTTGILFATALPAVAESHGKTCHTYTDGSGHSAPTCVEVNQHGQLRWLQGLVDVSDQGNYVCIWIDYVKLFKNGQTIQNFAGLTGCVYGWNTNNYEEQTDWNHACIPGATYTAEVRFKIKWSGSSSSTWKVDASNNYTPSSADCTV